MHTLDLDGISIKGESGRGGAGKLRVGAGCLFALFCCFTIILGGKDKTIMVPVGTIVREVIGIDQKADPNRQDFTVRLIEDLKVGFKEFNFYADGFRNPIRGFLLLVAEVQDAEIPVKIFQ